MDIAVLCHLYYDRMWEEIKTYINKIKIPKYLYFNVTNDGNANLIKKDYPDARVTISENRGADIGGFLSSINAWMEDDCPGKLMLKCHTKGSDGWRHELLDPLFNNFDDIVSSFNNEILGMVGSRRWLNHASSYNHVADLCKKFDLSPHPLYFIGGTIFFVRSSICKEFFTKFDPIAIKNELEPGKPGEPSKTHAWERLLGKPFIGKYAIVSEDKCYNLADYDEAIYLSNYQDVREAVMKGKFESGLHHYLLHGKKEKRIAKENNRQSLEFDEEYYLSNNVDVRKVVDKGDFISGYEHFIRHGNRERRKHRFL